MITALAVTSGLLVVGVASAPSAVAATTSSGDAQATSGANNCTWTMSTAAISKTVTFASGSFTMTSMNNKLVSGGRQYVQTGTASSEFQFSWDGAALSGASGGWSCASGSAAVSTYGGQSVVTVTVNLTRSGISVVQHYTIFPSESLIQQSTDITNTDTATHLLETPSLIAAHVMQGDTSSTDVNYTTGTYSIAGAWTAQSLALSTIGSRAFDSYDAFLCKGWTNIATYTSSGYLGMQEWHDASPVGGYVWPSGEHPGQNADAARTFTAPATGSVAIAGTAAKMNALGNGVVVRITQNGRTVWGPTTIAGADTTGVSAAVSTLSVTAGDAIRFEINNNGDWTNDATSWDPTITYNGGSAYTASTGYSSTQGANQWSYQDYRGCTAGGFQTSSTDYIPAFSLWNRTNKDGLYLGFAYHGRWRTSVGNLDGGPGDLTVTIPNYSSSLAASATYTGPFAFVGTYVSDADDMTNRLLDWQYRYMWDYTRPDYFAKIRMLGYWQPGSQTLPPSTTTAASYDPNGMLNQVVGLTDRLRSVGADIFHRDYGWWNVPWGDWNGPDWKVTNDYLAKSGMKQVIYQPAYYASAGSTAYNSNPGLFPYSAGAGDACFGIANLTDLSQSAAVTRLQSIPTTNAANWGDYEWRGDFCWQQDATGATQLAQQRGYFTALEGFLNARPNSAFQGVSSGGAELSWDFARYASSLSFTDSNGLAEYRGASALFPMDKMSAIPDAWNPAYCDTSYNKLLAWNPDFTGDTTDATALTCMARLISTYHYLVKQGVAGRWVKQYHPTATDADSNWYQRVSQDGTKSLLIYMGSGTNSSVTVKPKGLSAATSFDIRTNAGTVLSSATGATLSSSGVTLSSAPAGTLIFLNLKGSPGLATDATAPSAPSGVTATAGTNMSQTGVEVSWTAGGDTNWLNNYEVQRDGVTIGTPAIGTYWFDRAPSASPSATYRVRSVDGDGNTSAWATATPSGSSVAAVDDALGAGLTYSGSWVHDNSSYPQAYGATLSGSNTAGAYAEYTFTGSSVTLYARPSQDSGYATISIDGSTDTSISLFASTSLTYQVPVYSKTWTTAGTHTIRVTVNGSHDPRSSNNYVVLDGLQYVASSPTTVTEDSSGLVTYSGTGWQHNTGSYPAASNSDVSWSNTTGDSASYTFTGRSITLISEPGLNKGEADVSIDGTFVTRLDLYGRAGDWFRSQVFRKSWTSSGTHTITITVVGKRNQEATDNYVIVDAFQVR